MKLLQFATFLAAATVLQAEVLPLPDGLRTQWDKVPVVEDGGERGHMVINGLWRFQPGDPKNPTSAEPTEPWSHIWVPGSWHRRPDWNEPGIVAYAKSPLWDQFEKQHRDWPVGWYERTIEIPETWEGRRVFVKFSDLGTRAQVWLDGTLCGSIEESNGRIEITQAVKPGTEQLLRVKVLAVPNTEPSLFLQGEMAEQVILKPAKLETFGLGWDVELVSEPAGPIISPPLVSTSVKDPKLSIRFRAPESGADQPLQVAVTVRDMEGKELKSWPPREIIPGEDGTVRWKADWLPERLWDIDDPYLMQAEVTASGEGWTDTRRERFGFREFEIRGKEFFLNGTRVRLRPLPGNDLPDIPELIDQMVQGRKAAGANLMMVHDGHGPDFFIDAADRYGMLVFAELPEIKDYVVRGTWEENREDWEQRMKVEIERQFNHPSIVMWWSGFNVFANGEDQNPARLGQPDELMVENDAWQQRIKTGLEAMKLIRKADPTRPAYSHNGSVVGDIQTTNTYLNLIPLQEREEWLSDWAENGEVPYLACEFGTPLNNTFMQGKQGGGWLTIGRGPQSTGSANSAMMLTEYAAIYLGPEAYVNQSPEYAKAIRDSHIDGFIHTNLQYKNPQPDPIERMMWQDTFQKLHGLFLRNTLRSWRTWGMTGGMNLWALSNQAYKELSWRKNPDNMPMGEFKPGTRGIHRGEISRGLYYNFMDGGWEPLSSSKDFRDNYAPLLAWIAGSEEQGFTDKDHHFQAGSTVAKQVALINDERDPVVFRGQWTAKLADEALASGEFEREVEPGTNAMVPFEFALPGEVDKRTDGVIEIEVAATPLPAEGGESTKSGDGDNADEGAKLTLADSFDFRVYPSARKSKLAKVALIPGSGETGRMLETLGIETTEWSPESKLPLVIGRGGIPDADLEAVRDWTEAGGVVLISSPAPEWLRDVAGFRVTPHPSRRAFPTSWPHPVTEGIDGEDLRDWNSAGTLIEAYPEYSNVLEVAGDKPYYGWRWGNRGSVASVMIEKPHHGGWRPILEGEFDLAYSPLLELDLGRGRILLSTLDLEDNVPADPSAQALAVALLDYVADFKPGTAVRSPVAFAGEKRWENILHAMGVEVTEDRRAAKLLVIAKGHGLSDSELRSWLAEGRNILALRGAELPEFTGWSWATPADFYGTDAVPDWPEAGGLSVSDFHMRAPYPMFQLTGEGVGADGMLARQQIGEGVIMATALDPTWIRADQQPFLRLTVWRQSRAVVQLISSLGGQLTLDRQIFDLETLPTGQMPLAGEWEAKAIRLLPGSASPDEAHKDPGMEEESAAAVAELAGGEGWTVYEAPGPVENASEEWDGKDGEFILRKVVEIPKSWAGKKLLLELDVVDDHDVTFWNGEEIGQTGTEHPTPWSAKRIYAIPGDKVQAGRNVITIRVWDRFDRAGLLGHKDHLKLRPQGARHLDWYHPDYRRDFAYGDDPYRYYRW